jgi:hypothetical protein
METNADGSGWNTSLDPPELRAVRLEYISLSFRPSQPLSLSLSGQVRAFDRRCCAAIS